VNGYELNDLFQADYDVLEQNTAVRKANNKGKYTLTDSDEEDFSASDLSSDEAEEYIKRKFVAGLRKDLYKKAMQRKENRHFKRNGGEKIVPTSESEQDPRDVE
jgi:hypothetical protein